MHKLVNGEKVPLTEEEIKEFNERAEKWKEKQKANAWLEGRIKEYPSIQKQLDILYHEGFDGWKTMIKQVKDKYPKPE